MQFTETERSGPLTRKEDITVKTTSFLPGEQLRKGMDESKTQIVKGLSSLLKECALSTPTVKESSALSICTWVKAAKKATFAFMDLLPHKSGASCTCENSLHALPPWEC